MSNPLHAKHYADEAVVAANVEIVENVPLARDTWRVRIACPEMASRIVPGQFVMLRLSGCVDPLIGRPLAMYDVWRESGAALGVDVVYLVKGKLTTQLARCMAGQRVDIWGPLGNGFPSRTNDHLILVAGGIGQTPFLALGKQRLGLAGYGFSGQSSSSRARRVTICYGARTADLLAGVEDFRKAGMEVRLCTDDGTAGRHGLVTEELEQLLASHAEGDASVADRGLVHVICCGPERMMEAAAGVAEKYGVSCEVSLETPMACGIGICFSCVAKIRQDDGQWDYKRTCVDGPVFDAALVQWD